MKYTVHVVPAPFSRKITGKINYSTIKIQGNCQEKLKVPGNVFLGIKFGDPHTFFCFLPSSCIITPISDVTRVQEYGHQIP